MTGFDHNQGIYIGWDVGGWNCDKNPNSRDAIVILDHKGLELGQSWRGNLRNLINEASSSESFLEGLVTLCGLEKIAIQHATLAIDAPLGLPSGLIRLASKGETARHIEDSASNPYLFRHTEIRLAVEGITPLSSIKDMIGSQSTKAMHVISKFAPSQISTGVWTDCARLTVIETYPSLCRGRREDIYEPAGPDQNGREADISDAGVCARIAREFQLNRSMLEPPTEDTPLSEGWIWAPKRNLDSNGWHSNTAEVMNESREIQNIYKKFRAEWCEAKYQNLFNAMRLVQKHFSDNYIHELGHYAIFYTPICNDNPDYMLIGNYPTWFHSEPTKAEEIVVSLTSGPPQENLYQTGEFDFAMKLRNVFDDHLDVLYNVVGLNRFWIQMLGDKSAFKEKLNQVLDEANVNAAMDEYEEIESICEESTREIVSLLKPKTVFLVGREAQNAFKNYDPPSDLINLKYPAYGWQNETKEKINDHFNHQDS